MVKKFAIRLDTISEALDTLHRSIELLEEHKEIVSADGTDRNKELLISLRDSMIQRFEYCTDLFWKVLKLYMEEIEKVELVSSSPRGVIRKAVEVRLITEQEGFDCTKMIDSRNATSHIYHEEIAEEIAHKIPSFFALMKTITGRL